MLVRTQSLAAFACMSKACAPPPVGKGGSLRDGGSSTRPSAAAKGGTAPSLDTVVSHVAKKGSGARTTRVGGPNKKMVDFVHMTLGILPDNELFTVPTKQKATAAVVGHLLKDKGFIEFTKNEMDKKPVSRLFKSFAERALATVGKYRIDDPSTIRSIVKELKKELPDLSSMSDEEVVGRLYAKGMIDQWADDSGGGADAVAYHLAAGEVHGIDSSDMFKFLGSEKSAKARAIFSDNRSVMMALARSEYAATQEILKQSGVKEVIMYRGLKYPQEVAVGNVVRIPMNPLSSWSLERDIAESFAAGDPWANSTIAEGNDFVIAMSTPVEQIQSFFGSGRGCLREWEFVLIGQPSEAIVVDVLE